MHLQGTAVLIPWPDLCHLIQTRIYEEMLLTLIQLPLTVCLAEHFPKALIKCLLAHLQLLCEGITCIEVDVLAT